MKLSFSRLGLVLFVLPMLINIAYVMFPPAEEAKADGAVPRWVEGIEQVSRAAYLFAVTLLVSRENLSFRSVCFSLAAVFLVLYYAVWLRYFMGGRKIALLSRSFLFVPMPPAVFPALYYLCAAIWLHNLPAAIIMVIFGAAHLTVSIQSFR